MLKVKKGFLKPISLLMCLVFAEPLLAPSIEIKAYSNVSFETLGITGSFTGWGGSPDIPMTDDDGDGIYEASVTLGPGSYEYIVRADNNWNYCWGAYESEYDRTLYSQTNLYLSISSEAVLTVRFDTRGQNPDLWPVSYSKDSGEFINTGKPEMLTNTSSINTDVIGMGETLTIKCSAEGGKGKKKYLVQYQKDGDADRNIISDYSFSDTVTFTPSSRGKYTIFVCVKDEDGKTEEKAFAVTVGSNSLFRSFGVIGSFTDWGESPDIPMTDFDGDGIYEASVTLEPGSYEYKVRADSAWNYSWGFCEAGSGMNSQTGFTVSTETKIRLTIRFDTRGQEPENWTVSNETAEVTRFQNGVICFNNQKTSWSDVYIYLYDESGSQTVTNSSWPGVRMQEAGKDCFIYELPDQFEGCEKINVIFNNYGSSSISQVSQKSIILSFGEKKLYNGSEWTELPDGWEPQIASPYSIMYTKSGSYKNITMYETEANGIYIGTFDVDSGSYIFKICRDGSWDYSWGAYESEYDRTLNSQTYCEFTAEVPTTVTVKFDTVNYDMELWEISYSLDGTNFIYPGRDPINKSRVSSYNVGYRKIVGINCSSIGGIGKKQYAVYLKREEEDWTVLSDFSEKEYVETNILSEGDYCIKVIVKDEAGTTDEKNFNINVPNPPVFNNSHISTTTLRLGESVSVYCSSSGGKGIIKHAVYLKVDQENDDWKLISDFSENDCIEISEFNVGDNFIKIVAKDEYGTTAEKLFDITVIDPRLVNNSSISTASAYPGESIKIACSSYEGIGEKQYAVYIKQDGEDDWRVLSDYSEIQEITFTPSSPGIYTIKTCVKDENGDTAEKEFQLYVSVNTGYSGHLSITGSMTSWGNEPDIPMADFDGDGIFEASIDLEPGNYQYKIRENNSWDKSWGFYNKYYDSTLGQSCTVSADYAFTLTVRIDTTIEDIKKWPVTYELSGDLQNTSKVSDNKLKPNEKLTINCSSVFGKGEKLYAVYYKKDAQTNWKILSNYSTADTVYFTPKETGVYTIQVRAKDEDGNTSAKNFSLQVTSYSSFCVSFDLISWLNGKYLSLTDDDGDGIYEGSSELASGDYDIYVIGDKNWKYKWGEIRNNKTFNEGSSIDLSLGNQTEVFFRFDTRNKDQDLWSVSYSFDGIHFIHTDIRNTSYLETQTVRYGDTLTVHYSSESVAGEKCYSSYYQKEGQAEWTVISEASTERSADIGPLPSGNYILKVIFTDNAGNTDESLISFTVYPESLVNTSLISTDSLALGDKLEINCSCTGGSGDNLFSVYYLTGSQTEWTTVCEASADSIIEFVPQTDGIYRIKIVVNDSRGKSAEKTFDFTVADTSGTPAENFVFNEENGVIEKYIEQETDVVIPKWINQKMVVEIAENAFSECNALKSIELPASVSRIGNLFTGCAELQSIVVSADNPYMSSENGVLFNKDKSKLIAVPRGMKGNYVVPDSVSEIGDRAFCGCTGLMSVTLPDSVCEIGDHAFCGCTGLTSVTLPDSVCEIGDHAFYGCTGLTSVTLPDSVYGIGNRTFYGCTGLTSITLPDSVCEVGEYAFYGCTGLKKAVISGSVKQIGTGAFCNCTQLSSVELAEGTEFIGKYAFSYCDSLTEIFIPGSAASIGTWTFDDGITIIGRAGSYAETYAREENLTFKLLPLQNLSVLLSEKVSFGGRISVSCKADGGSGSYSYAVYYKKAASDTWTTGQKYSENTEVSIKPGSTGKYDVCVKIKDSKGTIVKKYFTVNVASAPQNTSTISAAKIGLGDTVTVSAKAKGGSGEYVFGVYYKKNSSDKWITAQSYSANQTVVIKPASAVKYTVCVKIKDSSGTIVKKEFTVSVTKPTNTSTVSGTEISKGGTVSVSCSAVNGAGGYQYAVYSKQSSASQWSTVQSYSENSAVNVTFKKSGSYDILIKAKDKKGNIAKTTFTVAVV